MKEKRRFGRKENKNKRMTKKESEEEDRKRLEDIKYEKMSRNS